MKITKNVGNKTRKYVEERYAIKREDLSWCNTMPILSLKKKRKKLKIISLNFYQIHAREEETEDLCSLMYPCLMYLILFSLIYPCLMFLKYYFPQAPFGRDFQAGYTKLAMPISVVWQHFYCFELEREGWDIFIIFLMGLFKISQKKKGLFKLVVPS